MRNTTQANESVIEGNSMQDFQCCCSIARQEFEIDGTTGILIFNCVLLIPTSVFATVGNFLVLVSIWTTPSLHSPANVLIFGLALSDLGVGLVVEPIAFVYTVAKIKGISSIFCSITISLRILMYVLCFVSLFTITAIGLDMYVALYLHLRYKEIVTAKKVIAVLVGIWTYSTVSSPFFLFYYEVWNPLTMSVVLLCIVATTTSFCKVFRIVRHHHNQIDVQLPTAGGPIEDDDETLPNIAQHGQSLVNKFLIYCLFVFSYLPSLTVSVIVETTGLTALKQNLFEFSMVIVFLNSALNPFMYRWRFPQIRAAVVETTRKLLRQN